MRYLCMLSCVWVFQMIEFPTLRAQEVGIGTTVPGARLDIQAPGTYTSNLLNVEHGSVTYLVITSGGKMGVRRSNPQATLHVQGGILSSGYIGLGDSIPSGNGNPMLAWSPKMAAFRAGIANGNQWVIPNLGYYSVAFGVDNIASGSHSAVSGGQINEAAGNQSTVGGGYYNRVRGDRSFIGAGDSNFITAQHDYSIIGGGKQNTVTAIYGVIVGGKANNVSADYGFIGGGQQNTVSGIEAAILGGSSNIASGANSVVLGGVNNQTSAILSAVGGSSMKMGNAAIGSFAWGRNDTLHSPKEISTPNAFLIGPMGATYRVGINVDTPLARLHITRDGSIYADGSRDFGDSFPPGPKVAFIWNPRLASIRAGEVTGTQWNDVNVANWTVAFGYNTQASAHLSAVGGGEGNVADAYASTISGGLRNKVSPGIPAGGQYGFIGGGKGNQIDQGDYSVIVGGDTNYCKGSYGFIGGGRSNQIISNVSMYSSILGGDGNRISLGWYSTISGGQYNYIVSDYSWAGGRGMYLDTISNRTFAWGYDGSFFYTYIKCPDCFLIGPVGNSYKVGINLDSPTYALELPNNFNVDIGRARANAWITYSDRRLKSEIVPIEKAVSTIMRMRPVYYFQHNSHRDPQTGSLEIEKEGMYAYGFLAQELYEVIPEVVDKPKDESKDLWSVDYTRIIPILTAAIQEQQRMIEHLQRVAQENEELRHRVRQIKALEGRIEELEAMLQGQSAQ